METEIKYYTDKDVSKVFSKLTKDEKINILYEAIDITQQYNGRSRFLCIAMALGYENFEGESTTYTKD